VALQAPPEEGGASAEDTLKKLQQAVATTPTDLEARHQLALKCFQLQRFEAAMNECLEVGVRRAGGKGGWEEEGRIVGMVSIEKDWRLRMKEREIVWLPSE
jgi:hypothetical protein